LTSAHSQNMSSGSPALSLTLFDPPSYPEYRLTTLTVAQVVRFTVAQCTHFSIRSQVHLCPLTGLFLAQERRKLIQYCSSSIKWQSVLKGKSPSLEARCRTRDRVPSLGSSHHSRFCSAVGIAFDAIRRSDVLLHQKTSTTTRFPLTVPRHCQVSCLNTDDPSPPHP
jgi:hypothetical protein